ncbi:hypothetical protein [uncultured Treponema sp.]|uniref:hypothetical protein n=1 Tax=uncultured Treponema sp. TaxID=162155 RepID=UPI0025E81EC4|nr:hypothetical protein [uncultured Treponema sp.]
MKKLTTIFSAFLLSLPTFGMDFEIALMPQLDFHTAGDFDNSFSGTVSLDSYPFTVRGRDKIGFGFQGGVADIKALTLDDTPLYYGDLALTYQCRLHDRFASGLQVYGGMWNFPKVEEKNTESMSGSLFGGRIFADFYALPELKFGVFAGYSKFKYKPEDFTNRIDLGVSLKYSFTKGIFAKKVVELDENTIEPIFPVFYSFYNENSFGKLVFFNGEENKISDVTVSVLIPEYMTLPKICAQIEEVGINEYFEAELTAFINETILSSLAAHKTEGKVIVSYRSLGKRITSEQVLDFTALNRNAMNWNDDRKAAAFVSSHDGAANKISKLAKSIILKNPQNDYTQNLDYARGIFATLKAYGVSYVKDPTSPFSSGETLEIDFLQFPYQTLLYSGGDCDDLSILNCAIFESIGIQTAFITVPGHIFMAIDSGVSSKRASKVLLDGRYIIQGEKAWIPLEATVCQDNFEIARTAGYNQWKSAAKKGEAELYPLSEAWQHYKAVSVPESDADIELPSVERVLKYLK